MQPALQNSDKIEVFNHYPVNILGSNLNPEYTIFL
jgi:hypothetical protein